MERLNQKALANTYLHSIARPNMMQELYTSVFEVDYEVESALCRLRTRNALS